MTAKPQPVINTVITRVYHEIEHAGYVHWDISDLKP